jgi:hypothetical protein
MLNKKAIRFLSVLEINPPLPLTVLRCLPYILRPCAGGGIGRRTRFRCERRKAWVFESPPAHHLALLVSVKLSLPKRGFKLRSLDSFFW